MRKNLTIRGNVYLTGNNPRALWQKFRFWRAYRRPVTYSDLRRIAHGVCYRDGNYHKPGPVGADLLDRVIREAERPVFGRENKQ